MNHPLSSGRMIPQLAGHKINLLRFCLFTLSQLYPFLQTDSIERWEKVGKQEGWRSERLEGEKVVKNFKDKLYEKIRLKHPR